jgi:lipopolysaccharide/colanic/teichoic acid biosynthesis glycosyltransferase
MHANRPMEGLSLTVGDDVRITRAGAILRRSKIDELPQLFDVLVGNMSLVGPRPEVPSYVARWSDDDRRVILSVRPGITDLASIRYRNESALLKYCPDPEKTYLDEVMPAKIRLYREYVERRSMWFDLYLLIQTAFVLLFGSDQRNV